MTLNAELKRLTDALDRLPPEEPKYNLARLTDTELSRFDVLAHRDTLTPSEETEFKRLFGIAESAGDPARELLVALGDTRQSWPSPWAKNTRGDSSPLEDAYRALQSALDSGDAERIRVATEHGTHVLSAATREETT